MDSEYAYEGIPLTPAIAEYLISSYLRGQRLRRSQIIDAVEKIHVDSGGSRAESADLSRSVKKALENLKDRGLASNPSTGWWLIGQNKDVEDRSSQFTADLGDQDEKDNEALEFKVEAVLGEGAEAVYVYYYPAYKESALAAGNNRWRCKIGRTDCPPKVRVSNQTTGMPERPVLGLVFKTDDSRVLESVIQGILSLRGQWCEDSPGAEWFITSPDEVMGIIRLLFPESGEEKPQVA